MVFAPFIEAWDWAKAHNPGSPFKRRRLSFITIHYLYLGSLAIIGSILIYPAGGIPYIDSLFFGAGAATQSGLNTVDVNALNTYQQIVLYFIGMIGTPIWINTFVVFVRLYWFEKRFQHIVKEARNLRRTRSRANTQAKDEKDIGQEERGVNGRSIVVLHNDQNDNGSISGSSDTHKDSIRSNDHHIEPTSPDLLPQRTPSFHRDIMFADEVNSGAHRIGQSERIPPQMSPEQHVAFLEKQRNPKDDGVLRIPGPREFDRGDVPETVTDHEKGGNVGQQLPSPIGVNGSIDTQSEQLDRVIKFNSDDHPIKRNITIDEPNHPRSNEAMSPLHKLTLRKIGTSRSKATTTFDKAPSSARLRSRSGTFGSLTSSNKEKDPMPYLSYQPTVGRNSAFVDLTEEQREELGGIEYRSLKTLVIILISYYVVWHLFGVVTFLPWIVRSSTWGPVVDGDGQNRVWWGIFTPASMFNDLGFTLTPDSMISFETAVLPLFIGSFLIVIGNTGFPCMLRFTIWTITKIVPTGSGVWEELKFLLDHPRRCFTLLFPSAASWWLFWILVLLNGIDLIFFIILDLNDSTVTSISPSGYRVLDGLFQATSTRTAGLSVVNLANLHPGILVSYLIMMYISVFPIAVSVRRTNVYEEKSLGIYGSKEENAEDEHEPSYVGAHLRRQLSFDLWYIFLGLFIVAIAEGGRLQDVNDPAFSLFACLFEIVSAYGTVGLSLGYPTVDASFSTEFSVVSKLVIIAMMVRGRHRGLPYELDRAILLPSESLHKKEDQDASKRMQRRNSAVSTGPGISRAPTNATTSVREQDPSAINILEKTHAHGARDGLGRMMAGLASGSEKINTMKENH